MEILSLKRRHKTDLLRSCLFDNRTDSFSGMFLTILDRTYYATLHVTRRGLFDLHLPDMCGSELFPQSLLFHDYSNGRSAWVL